jgi:hypothetical protein
VLCGTTGFFIKQEMRREGREKLTEKDLWNLRDQMTNEIVTQKGK